MTNPAPTAPNRRALIGVVAAALIVLAATYFAGKPGSRSDDASASAPAETTPTVKPEPKVPLKAALDTASLIERCEKAPAPECVRLALRDEFRAASVLERACESCDVRGCALLGMFSTGGELGVTKDHARAVSLLQKSCDADDPMACVALSRVFLEGVVTDKDDARGRELRARARTLVERGCLAGDFLVCLSAEDFRVRGETETSEDADWTRRLLDRGKTLGDESCRSGDPDACGITARDLMRARPVPVDRVLSTLQQACDLGQSHSCYDLGLLTKGGNQRDGFPASAQVPPDPQRAVNLFVRGCELGRADSCTAAAEMLENGAGISTDPARALALHERACDGRKADDCLAAGNMLERGTSGNSGDPARAKSLFSRACTLGREEGCRLAGR
jgi:uncharacterized protein